MYDFIKNAQNNQLQIDLKPNINIQQHNKNTIFNKNMNYYVCSFGGSGSTILFNYLSNFGNVYHIHDRYPSDKLKYVGKKNTDEDVYSEWFNNIEINEDEIQNYKVIFIYRNPLKVIYSRYINAKGPNIQHLKHIMCDNNGNINLNDVLRTNKDLYKIEEFFDNYTQPKERNYKIYCVKYEQFWDNISLFNKVLDIPDITQLYPKRYENNKKIYNIQRLYSIYFSLINKMNKMKFIEII
jgi:hypothetical protein